MSASALLVIFFLKQDGRIDNLVVPFDTLQACERAIPVAWETFSKQRLLGIRCLVPRQV